MSNTENYEQLRAELEQLRAELQQVKQDNQFKDKVIRKLTHRANIRASIASLPNKVCPSMLKIVTLATFDEIASLKMDSEGYTLIWIPNIADRAGVSVITIKRELANLDKCGAIEKKHGRAKNGMNRLSIRFTEDFLANPPSVLSPLDKVQKERKADIKACSCGCTVFDRIRNRHTKDIYQCTACGETQVQEATKVAHKRVEAPTMAGIPTMEEIENSLDFMEACDIPEWYVPGMTQADVNEYVELGFTTYHDMKESA